MKKPFLQYITLNVLLSASAIFIAFIIISTTIIVKSRPAPQILVVARGENKVDREIQAEYRKLGSLRAVTRSEQKSGKGVNVVIKPVLSYDSGDTEFFEELSRKNSSIKSIFVQYFSSRTKDELKSSGEEKIKAELKEQINSILTLNKIREIYFDDLNYLD